MMRRAILCLLAFGLLSIVAGAEQPPLPPPGFAAVQSTEIRIEGPAEVRTSRPAWYTIVNVPSGAAAGFMPHRLLDTAAPRIGAGWAHFWTDQPGDYTLNALVIDWEKHTWVAISTTVTVAGTAPDPDPPPDPVSDLTTNVRQWSATLPAAERSAVAKAFLTAISEIDSGTITTTDEAQERSRVLDREAIGNDPEVAKQWKSVFFSKLQSSLQSLRDAGQLSTLAHVKTAYKQIADGLGG